ncbi:MAG: hypothetical protein C0505_03265 [Leptothrix sp. (in: Bacteria)]|nr:hypothetical protein [Leptothrix sp. (in: b-proteobacteria)]
MKMPNDRPRPLAELLQQVGAELRAQAPPAALQARVRAAARAAWQAEPAAVGRSPRQAAAAVRAWLGGHRGWPGLVAVCAGVLAATVLLRGPPPLPLVIDDGAGRGGFVSVAAAERWPRGAAAAWLVGTELQRERLPALGLPYDPARAGDTVRAELLLHPSGEVLAVRLLD